MFIEKRRAAVALIRKNLAYLGIEQDAEVLPTDAVKGLAWLANEGVRADFIFLDPPYADVTEYARVLDLLGKLSLLAPGGRVIVEHEKRRMPAENIGNLTRIRTVEQGDGVLSFYQSQEPDE